MSKFVIYFEYPWNVQRYEGSSQVTTIVSKTHSDSVIVDVDPNGTFLAAVKSSLSPSLCGIPINITRVVER